uniref:Uncharacterized protein n=1 Tax=Anopheles atroparvus TaxID=41427 RepID=A0A182IJT7_ANOAO
MYAQLQLASAAAHRLEHGFGLALRGFYISPRRQHKLWFWFGVGSTVGLVVAPHILQPVCLRPSVPNAIVVTAAAEDSLEQQLDRRTMSSDRPTVPSVLREVIGPVGPGGGSRFRGGFGSESDAPSPRWRIGVFKYV